MGTECQAHSETRAGITPAIDDSDLASSVADSEKMERTGEQLIVDISH